MTAGSLGRDGDIEAFVVDRYLESLLARQPMDPDGVPDDLAATARRLAGVLPRYHPSFRFEEDLAARLAAVAAPASTAASSWPSPFPTVHRRQAVGPPSAARS